MTVTVESITTEAKEVAQEIREQDASNGNLKDARQLSNFAERFFDRTHPRGSNAARTLFIGEFTDAYQA